MDKKELREAARLRKLLEKGKLTPDMIADILAGQPLPNLEKNDEKPDPEKAAEQEGVFKKYFSERGRTLREGLERRNKPEDPDDKKPGGRGSR